jgi:hypothetical protein
MYALLLHIIAFEGHSEITISLNTVAMNLKFSGKQFDRAYILIIILTILYYVIMRRRRRRRRWRMRMRNPLSAMVDTAIPSDGTEPLPFIAAIV